MKKVRLPPKFDGLFNIISWIQIRNYLWNQTYISRFNEDGKKAKSKGNHIWNINAKKKPEGGWIFSPFRRRLAGTPQGIAYIGLRWTWAPRIWDPQASRSSLPVTFTSPNLPSWLSWKDDQLSGIPPSDAETCDIMVEARVRRVIPSYLLFLNCILIYSSHKMARKNV